MRGLSNNQTFAVVLGALLLMAITGTHDYLKKQWNFSVGILSVTAILLIAFFVAVQVNMSAWSLWHTDRARNAFIKKNSRAKRGSHIVTIEDYVEILEDLRNRLIRRCKRMN